MQEEAIAKTMQNEIEIDRETVSAEEISPTFGSSATPALPMKEFWNLQSTVSFCPCQQAVPLLQKDLMQSYAFSEGLPFRNRHRKRKTEYVVPFLLRPERRGNLKWDGCDCWGNHRRSVTTSSTPIRSPPGMYDVITAPDVTGVIAHEGILATVSRWICLSKRPRTRQRVYRQACCLPALLHARRSSRRTAGQQLSF